MSVPPIELAFVVAGLETDIAPDATAYAHRATNFVINIHGRWDEPRQDTACTDWARALHHPYNVFHLNQNIAPR